MSAPQPQPQSKLKEPWDTIVFVLMIVGTVVGTIAFMAWLDRPGNSVGPILAILCMGIAFVLLAVRIPLGVFIGLILFFRKR